MEVPLLQKEVERSGQPERSPRSYWWHGSQLHSHEGVCTEDRQILEEQLSAFDFVHCHCCVIKIDDTDEPTNCIGLPVYCSVVSAVKSCTRWILITERNDSGVVHAHVIIASLSRNDSLRRSLVTCMGLYNLNSHTNLELNLLKCAKAHKPRAILGYMLKNPIEIASNNAAWLDLSFSITQHRLHEPYAARAKDKQKKKLEVEDEIGPSDMLPITKDICNIMQRCGGYSLEDCIKEDSQLMGKYLHRPGLQGIVNNCAAWVKAQRMKWNIGSYKHWPPCPWYIHSWCIYQDIPTYEFDVAFYQWITQGIDKRNTLVFWGPSNTGKSAFISGLKQAVEWGEICNGNSGFNYEGLVGKHIGVWEEPLISSDAAEKAKQVLEGMYCSINIKWKAPTMLPRIPIIMTTNHAPWRHCSQEENAMRNRMTIWYCSHSFPRQPGTCCPSCELCCRCSDSSQCRRSERCPHCPSTGSGRTTSARSARRRLTSPLRRSGSGSGGWTGVRCDPQQSGEQHGTESQQPRHTSRSYRSQRKRSRRSPKRPGADESGSSSSSSTSTEYHRRPGRYHRPGDPDLGISSISSSTESADSDTERGRCDGHSDRQSGATGYSVGRGGGGGTTEISDRSGRSSPLTQESLLLGGTEDDSETIKINRHPPIAVGGQPCPCLKVPSKEDWCSYLSWLWHRYNTSLPE
ncbi:NS1 [Tasmanian devil-associated chapparvovirus 1]|uniref:NS1 n=1 Tax=Tasmanian devil-associated chapparvovirus 1 TaxID=2529482 RepID=A0A481W6I5_9VIRU|nr:NS1 [Tasmanian devil-associated chapparvovirus 1]QBJ04585.1 NS1 [Tasmanian devil-associated chapparvovirus 1]